MENNRPRGREKNVSGPGKTVQKRGEGLGTGPAGEAGGYKDRERNQSSGTRSAGTRGGLGMKPIILLEELEHTLPDALTLLYADDPGRAGADWKFSFAELYGG